MEAPGLKLKDDAFGFNPPLAGAGDGCCEGSNSSLSSQLIVSSSTQSLVKMVLPLCWNAKPSQRYYLALQSHSTLLVHPSQKHGQRLLSLTKVGNSPNAGQKQGNHAQILHIELHTVLCLSHPPHKCRVSPSELSRALLVLARSKLDHLRLPSVKSGRYSSTRKQEPLCILCKVFYKYCAES